MVIVENQVNVGSNCLKVIKALKDSSCKVLGVVTIFDYGFASTYKKLEKEGVDLIALTNLETVLHHAENMNIIDSEESKAIHAWQRKPSKWTKYIMADVKYESKIGQITANDAAVFAVLSNLENINHFRDVIPQDKIHELEVSSDRVRFKVEGLGQKIAIVILEKEEYKTIKFGAENMPIPFNIWIQLKQVAELDTRIRITIKTDMPAMFKMMFDKKMQQGLDQAVDMLCQVPYNNM